MSICKAKNCSSQEDINPDLTFHKFPLEDSQLLERWLTNIAPQNFTPEPEDVICSLHFNDDQFLDTLPRRLTRFAVPTLLFIDNKYIPVIDDNAETTPQVNITIKNDEESSSEQTSQTQSGSDDSISSIASEDDSDSDFELDNSKRKTRSSTRKKQTKKTSKSNGKQQKKKNRAYNPRFVGDFKESDLKSPEKMKRLWDISQSQIEDQKRKLRSYQQKNRRLESQVTRLKNIIKHLKTVHR